jgi:hypothetical protein
MESTRDNVRTGPGLGTALLAFGVFLTLLIGAYMTWRGRPDPGLEATTGDAGTASRIEQVAVMSEAREVSRAPDFRRAEVAAVMGHGILDLRQAEIRGREAVIEAFVLMGHATIRVPEDWTVVTKEMVLMGGLNNRTRREGADPAKRLRIEGLVLMGALTITH